MLSKRINNSGRTRYAGRYMNIIYILPGAISLASTPELSSEARKRLKWMDYYRKYNNVLQTCRYFGIAPKTFYILKKRLKPLNCPIIFPDQKLPPTNPFDER